MTLSKADFLSKRPRTVQAVPDVFGGTVYVRKLTVPEQTQCEAEWAALDSGDTAGFSAVALAFWMCTEAGEPFMTMEEARKNISHLEAPEVARIMKAGGALNQGLTEKAVETSKGN